jgi:biopolymer transport protein ExbB
MQDFLAGFSDLFAAGGVLWLLFLLAVFLWTLIVERYWYFYFSFPGAQEIALRRWNRYAKSDIRTARRARRQIVEEVFAETHRSVEFIQTLVLVILLLGLFASVGGLMRALDAVPVGGVAGQQLLARGIAAAAIPGIAAGSLVLVALFFTRALRDRADVETRLFADRLRRG